MYFFPAARRWVCRDLDGKSARCSAIWGAPKFAFGMPQSVSHKQTLGPDLGGVFHFRVPLRPQLCKSASEGKSARYAAILGAQSYASGLPQSVSHKETLGPDLAGVFTSVGCLRLLLCSSASDGKSAQYPAISGAQKNPSRAQ